MKKVILSLLVISPLFMQAQLGIRGGLNFAQISKASDIKSSSRSGFHVGLFFGTPGKKLISSQTELTYSRQGYDYKTSTNTGTVGLDYFIQTQLMGINITKFVQLQFGGQTAILLSANVDSSNAGASTSSSNAMSFYNRFDYGYALGVQIHPIKELIFGLRYNVSLAKVYKDLQTLQKPSFTSADAKNNVIQISAGWRFGKKH